MEIFLIFLFIIAPLSIITHEIAHVLGACIIGAQRVILTIGSGKPIASFNYRQVEIILGKIILMGGSVAHERVPPYSNKEIFLISFVGPLSNAIIAIAIFPLIDLEIFYITFLFNTWLAVFNFIPYKLKDKKSDGYICLKAFLKHSKD